MNKNASTSEGRFKFWGMAGELLSNGMGFVTARMRWLASDLGLGRPNSQYRGLVVSLVPTLLVNGPKFCRRSEWLLPAQSV